jgi:hypothetical protein
MKTTKTQRAIHIEAIARLFARLRRDSLQNVLLDLMIIPPSTVPEAVHYEIRGRRTHALAVVNIIPRTLIPDWIAEIMREAVTLKYPVKGGLARCWVGLVDRGFPIENVDCYFLLIDMPKG